MFCKDFLNISVLLFLSFFLACTPKVTEELSEVKTEIEQVEEKLESAENVSDCVKFKDSKRRNDALDAYSIYGDFLALDRYTESFEYWETVYKWAPAGLGTEPDVFIDGIMYYDHFYKTTEDPQQKAEYLEKIFSLYEEAIECFPFKKAEIIARRAFDYYYNYPDVVEKVKIFEDLKTVVDEKGNDTPIFTINPMTALLYHGYKDGNIDKEDASTYAYKLYKIIKANEDSQENADQWEVVRNYSLGLLSVLEGEENFYPCEYYSDVYIPMYENHPESCDTIQLVYSKLKWGGCESEPLLDELEERVNGDCQEIEVAESGSVRAALDHYQAGRFSEAIDGFADYVDRTEDMDRKADISLLIAKIYYSNLRQFSNARSWARKAAEYRPNWGEPYILIGKLYASSGSLCGPGTGWDSQVVTWPAIDKWIQARNIDPGSAAEANQLIREYQKYMPSVADIFARTHINEGDSFRVECWIQETTTVRAAPR